MDTLVVAICFVDCSERTLPSLLAPPSFLRNIFISTPAPIHMVPAELLVLFTYQVPTHLTQTTESESHYHELGTGTDILSLSGWLDHVNRELLADVSATSWPRAAKERAWTPCRNKDGEIERVLVMFESLVVGHSWGLVLFLPLVSTARFCVLILFRPV